MTDGAPRVERDEDVVRITMTRAAKRNALSREHLTQLLAAVTEAGESDAAGIVLGDGTTARAHVELGFRFISVATDLGLIIDGIARELGAANASPIATPA